VKDIRPFDTIDGEGFRELAQMFISIGARHGNVPVTDAIPHRTTISHAVTETAKELKDAIMPHFRENVGKHGGALTADGPLSGEKRTIQLRQTCTMVNTVIGLY